MGEYVCIRLGNVICLCLSLTVTGESVDRYIYKLRFPGAADL